MALSLPLRIAPNVAPSNVDSIRRLLGQSHNELTLQSSGTPLFYQTIWKCGCTIECVHADEGAHWYEPCGEHFPLLTDD